MAENLTTYVVYFRNGGQAEIACNTFLHEPYNKRVCFITGKRNVAIFETDAIVGFFEKQEDDDDRDYRNPYDL